MGLSSFLKNTQFGVYKFFKSFLTVSKFDRFLRVFEILVFAVFCPLLAFFGNFNLNSFHILPLCHHVSWSIGTKAKISVIDTKGYQKSGIRTQLYLCIWAVGVAQNACTRFFGTEEVFY